MCLHINPISSGCSDSASDVTFWVLSPFTVSHLNLILSTLFMIYQVPLVKYKQVSKGYPSQITIFKSISYFFYFVSTKNP